MDRRNFIAHGGVAALALAGGGRAFAAPHANAVTTTLNPNATVNTSQRFDPSKLLRVCRVRPNINTLTAAQLTALRAGVTAMQARPISDPTSWAYQAAMHGSNAAPPANSLWNNCQHRNEYFLAWHRFYIYYFERILRKASGSPDLMLPYWDWTADPALPAAFRTAAANSLYTSHRFASVNSGTALPGSAVASAGALALPTFDDFNDQVELTPHGSVHNSVGGWMTSFNTAAQDPIFWLHHCNVDRLWEAWLAQGGGRANRSDAPWRAQTFQFYDDNGTRRTVKMGDALATCNSFGYNYIKQRTIPPVFAQTLAVPLSEAVAAKVRAPASAVETAPTLKLGARASATLELPPPSAGAVAQRTYLAFDDLDIASAEGFYEIYLNPPPNKEVLDFSDPSYAGNLVLFGLTAADRRSMNHAGHGAMAEGKPRRVFDITGKLAQLRKTRGFDPAKLRVVLVLRLPEGEGKGAVPESRGQVGRVRVITQ